jgi:hypothetical protein
MAQNRAPLPHAALEQQWRKRLMLHPLCASSALPSATLAGARSHQWRTPRQHLPAITDVMQRHHHGNNHHTRRTTAIMAVKAVTEGRVAQAQGRCGKPGARRRPIAAPACTPDRAAARARRLTAWQPIHRPRCHSGWRRLRHPRAQPIMPTRCPHVDTIRAEMHISRRFRRFSLMTENHGTGFYAQVPTQFYCVEAVHAGARTREGQGWGVFACRARKTNPRGEKSATEPDAGSSSPHIFSRAFGSLRKPSARDFPEPANFEE